MSNIQIIQGALLRNRAWKRVVRHRSGGQGDQDLGLGQRQAQGLPHWPRLRCQRSRRLQQAAISVFLRGGSTGVGNSCHPYSALTHSSRQVKCWDLEYNKVIRHYHGHLSAVYDLALHPTLDVLVSCGRDSTARVWDMRSKVAIVPHLA